MPGPEQPNQTGHKLVYSEPAHVQAEFRFVIWFMSISSSNMFCLKIDFAVMIALAIQEYSAVFMGAGQMGWQA